MIEKDILNAIPLWEDHTYKEEKEPFLDIILGSELTLIQEICLHQLVYQTEGISNQSIIATDTDFIRKHIDTNGDMFYIGSNCYQKALKKNALVNTLTNRNEIVQIPQDTNQIWFISPTIRIS